ncbi:MAG: GNAT family N-acetyltransferase [Cyanobacteria bacterium J06600_6]
MDTLEFILATEQDLLVLNNLYADMNDKPLMSESEITKVWQQIQEVPNYYIYLAYLENKSIGTFSLLFMPTMMHPSFHKSAILDSVTILSNFRNKGYGKQMVQKALEISAEAGCYKVTLSSNKKRDRAHKFYLDLGFKQHGWSFSYQLAVPV